MSIGKKLEFVSLRNNELAIFAIGGDRNERMSTLIDEVEQWCQTNDCGVRLSFNAFRFRTEQERTFFLLRWQ